MADHQKGTNKTDSKYYSIPLLLLFALVLMNCAPSSKVEQEPPLQETKFFDNFTLDAVWEAVLLAIDDLEFAIQKDIKESGFIYAQAKTNPDLRYLPPHLNVYVREESGRISVNCHAVIPGRETDLQTSSAIVKQFFTALAIHLMQ
jgi:hypothetical protein